MARATKKFDKLPILYQDFPLLRNENGSVRGLDEEKRTVRVQFSSEAVVKRWFGDEILDHSPSSVDMSRIQGGAAVLLEHSTSQRCGITEGGEITAKKTGEAIVRFARTPLGDSVMGEVKDGTLRYLSVGYRVEKFEVNEDEDEYRAMRWTPLEVSFVGIPADTSAKVLRSNEAENQVMIIHRNVRLDPQPGEVQGGGNADPEPGDIDNQGDGAENRRAAMEAEVREIYALGQKWEKQYPGASDQADECARKATGGLSDMRKWLVDEMSKKPPEIMTRVQGGKPIVSYGEAFCRTESYKRFGKNVGSKRSIVCEMPDRLSFRTTFSATTEALTSIQKLPGVPGILDQQPLAIADLFGQGQTGSLTIRYIQEDSFTNAATAVAEGAAKPEATLNVSEVDATVRKIAAFTKVTDEMLADFEQMSSYINSRLAYMVQALEDNHLLNGTGNTNQIKGVLNFTGLQTTSGAVNPVDGVMKAIALVRGANGSGFGEPDAIVCHPKDWLTFKLAKDGNQQYYGGGPFSGIYGQGMYSNVYNMWGLPCVVTTSIAQGTCLVGAFRTAAQIFRRMGLTIEATNSNEDDFKNNLVMIRAEERLALAVYQPAKFCTVTGIPNIVL